VLSLLAEGTLVADPQERTSSAAKPYATASLRAPWRRPVRPGVRRRVPRGRRASAPGAQEGRPPRGLRRRKLTEWTGKGGELRHGLSVVADRVVSLYEVSNRRKAAQSENELKIEW